MATRMTVSVRYGSHTVALLQAVLKSKAGAVLELGGGVFSTHLLHSLCTIQKRPLYTYENNVDWLTWSVQYRSEYHVVEFVPEWADAPLESREWAVALVDHSPDARRAIELSRLAQRARYVIAHDADERYWHQYGYQHAFGEYKYRLLDDRVSPHTMILSNISDLRDFWNE